jgi:hypothetical protein
MKSGIDFDFGLANDENWPFAAVSITAANDSKDLA